ncbi:MAG TPA: M56 family metallopeptidase [Clostridia bacterium]|nr:M56 family metallopeptidase [Clostridia bacterium]
MDKLFLHIINMSITSSYVILFIVAVRLFLKKAPKIFSYGLWGVAFLRLIFPFSLESIFSLISINTKTIPENIGYMQTPQIQTGVTVIDSMVNRVLPAPAMLASVNPMQIWIFIGRVIWITGLAVLLIYGIFSTLRLSKKLKSATPLYDNIYKTDMAGVPFVFGLMNPRIYLPDGLSEAEKPYIIKHEQVHIKRKDHIIRFVTFVITSIHWFNPIVWLAFYLMGEDMELSCDESVMREMGHKIKKNYSNSLLALSVRKRIIGGSPVAFGENNTKGRIKNILNYKKPKFWVVTGAVIVVIVLAVGLLSNPIGNKGENIDAGHVSAGVGNKNKGFKTIPLTAEELGYFNSDEFFNGEYMNIRNQFLSSLYNIPEKIHLFNLFYCGSGLGEIPTEAEKSAIVKYNNWDMEPDCACTKISRANMDAVLTKYMGLTLADTEGIGLGDFTYLEQYDAYYVYHGDTNYRMQVSFSGGEREGDTIRLSYDDSFTNEGEIVLTLREQGDTYIFVSNEKVVP